MLLRSNNLRAAQNIDFNAIVNTQAVSYLYHVLTCYISFREPLDQREERERDLEMPALQVSLSLSLMMKALKKLNQLPNSRLE